ncbi:MAG: hypothetical protein BZ138_03855 [Methanosphaera sp. rholeuAM270]|nr:MAG: hypothetical protein BZ138_03855 [Methanosphaera sp. rholeuAM270]
MEEKACFGKPEGKAGEELLDSMDRGHTPVSLWSLSNLEIEAADVTLDIGCGSGLNVKRLFERSPRAKSYGLDYSATSVKKSVMMNQENVDRGNIEIVEASVIDMPFDDESFDIITAFETVYFWPDIVDSFREVGRVLKSDGKFFIVMDANGCYTPELEKITKDEDCVFYTDDELKSLLLAAGFKSITSIIRKRKLNQKIIKKYTCNVHVEELIDDDYPDDTYSELTEDGFPNSPEWYCIIAQK